MNWGNHEDVRILNPNGKASRSGSGSNARKNRGRFELFAIRAVIDRSQKRLSVIALTLLNCICGDDVSPDSRDVRRG